MAKEEQRGLIKYESRGQQVELSVSIVRDFLVTGKKELVTEQEIFYFLGICRARQLNPFVKDCYLIKYSNDPAAIVTAIDFYRSRARAAKDCTGWQKGVICLNKETGELRYSKGLILAHEELVGGWFKARPEGWTVDFELEVNLSGYIKKTSEGKATKFWSPENQPSQIMKVAESQGLRTVWPDLFQGTYTADELSLDLDSPGGPPPPGSPGDITPQPEPEKLDTSKFDKAVKKLKFDAETMTRLEQWLAETAANAGNKVGKVYTPDMIKVSCVSATPATPPYTNRWDQFLGTFKQWQDANYPAGAEAPEAEPEPTAAAGPPENAPDPTPEAKSLSERLQTAWHSIVAEGIALSALEPLCISKMSDINEGNIDGLEELIAKHGAGKKGK